MTKIKTLVAGLIVTGALVSSVASATAANTYSQNTSKPKFGVEVAIQPYSLLTSNDGGPVVANIFMDYKHIEAGAGILASSKYQKTSDSDRAVATELMPQVYVGYRFGLSHKIYASTGLVGSIDYYNAADKSLDKTDYALASYASLGYHITKHFDFFTSVLLLSYELDLPKGGTRSFGATLFQDVGAGIRYTFN